MKITKGEVGLIMAFRKATEDANKGWENEMKEVIARFKDINKFLCPDCTKILVKVAQFRDILKEVKP